MAKKTTAVATRPGGPSSGSVPAYLRDFDSTGEGVPTEAKDFLIPMAKVLDAKSPEVEKRGVNYVKGAEPGDILIKNAPVPLIKGDVGFLFQPCYIDEAVIEWLMRSKGGGGGAGFVARHPANFISPTNKDVVQKPHPEDPSKMKMMWVRKSTGNQLVETRYYGGYAISEDDSEPPMPLVLPFASTGHTVAKQWNMLIASKRINGHKANIYLVYYRVRTRLRERQQQSWYLFDISDAGENGETMWCPTVEDVERGRTLRESLTSGAKQFAQGEAPAGDSDEM